MTEAGEPSRLLVEVFRTDEQGRRERCTYALPDACVLIVVDHAHSFGPVWGFLGGTHDDPETQVNGELLDCGDGFLYS
jgi:hypothetical protein